MLSNEEQDKLLETALQVVNSTGAHHRFGIFRGLYSSNATERARAAQVAIKLGTHGVDIDVPYQNDTQFFADVHAVAELLPKDRLIMIQDNSGIPVHTAAELADREPQFVAMKVEAGDDPMRDASAILNATAPGRIALGANGKDKLQLVNELERGLTVFAFTGMFELVTPVIKAYRMGRVDTARCLFYKQLPAMIMEGSGYAGHRYLKRLFVAQGIFTSDADREPPPSDWDAREDLEVDRMVQYSMQLGAEVRRAWPNLPHCDAFPKVYR